MILSIDIGTSCGWAVLDGDGGYVASGTFRLKTRGHPGRRYLDLRHHLATIIRLYGPQVVVYEQVRRHAGTRAAHVYGGLLAVLQEWACVHELPIHGVEVSHVKRAATGKGRASKQEMQRAAIDRWALNSVGEDEADALWVGEAWRVRDE